MTSRNRELLGLLPAAILVTGGFTAVFTQRLNQPSGPSLTYGAIFLAVCLAAHLVMRRWLPYADPYLLPLVAVLASVGLVMIYRINERLAQGQAAWFAAGVVLFVLTIVFLRDYQSLQRYRYTIAAGAIVAMFLPRLPLIGGSVNGAYLSIRLGPIAFQPSEFAKVAIVIFLASYLHERRGVLVIGARRILGITLPPLKHLGPLLVIWGAAMLMLIVTRELGTSLMFFGAFLAILYVATNRASFVALGAAMFGLGAWFFGSTVPHVRERVTIWLHPFRPDLVNDQAYQIAQGLFAQADGGLFGTGIGQSILQIPGGGTIVPVPESDLIYAVITNELGLLGACALIAIYMLIVYRGLMIASTAEDSFSKLMAVGLTVIIALQVFVIVGGVTRVIPLTGVTLPFVAYGGSSIVANFVLLALLLIISDRARSEQRGAVAPRQAVVTSPSIVRPPGTAGSG